METDAMNEPDSKRRPFSGRSVWLGLILLVAGATLGGIAVKLLSDDHPASAPAEAPSERRIRFYRNPMDPTVTSPVPTKDDMGMDYIPVYEDEGSAAAGPGVDGPGVDGLATVTIDPARQQLIGLRTAPVTRGPVAGSWRTVGRVAVDPTRVRNTNIKVEGYIERMFVDFVGRAVREGEPLFSLYSPSLLAAENEVLFALRTRDELAKGGTLVGVGDSLVSSALRRLELWDVPAAETERLLETRQASRTLTFLSPISGVVTAKNVVEGARVNPGDTPYEITDLGMVWVMADAYETDLSHVRTGMSARLTVKAYPDRTFTGRVDFIDPIMNPDTRTATVHIHVINSRGDLKPEMFGEVTLVGAAHDGLMIPIDAVIRSGTMDVVFLSLGDGKFEPRQVQLGARNGDQVEVVSGISDGQEVVTRANFLVDSESQLRASLAAIMGN